MFHPDFQGRSGVEGVGSADSVSSSRSLNRPLQSRRIPARGRDAESVRDPRYRILLPFNIVGSAIGGTHSVERVSHVTISFGERIR